MGGWRLPTSKWHNPHKISSFGDASAAVAAYEVTLKSNPVLMSQLHQLKGKVLGCWCKKPSSPLAPCHGDVLARLADALPPHSPPR
jgi:hypothetical protein